LFALLVALAAVSCSSASDQTSSTEPAQTEPAQTETPITSSVAFCNPANAFVTDSAVRFITTPDAEVFTDIDIQLEQIAEQAPAVITNDIAALRTGFAAIGQAYASTGYEPTASFVLPTGVQQANLESSRNLEDYLLRVCELTRVRTEQIEQISEAFGIDDATTAECLHAQMGDIANIDPSDLSPQLMTTEVCGTSILGLLSGAGAASNS